MSQSRERSRASALGDHVAEALAAFLRDFPDLRGLRVALSGGRDSAVLLHAVAGLHPDLPVDAAHVHHGLHGLADEQAEFCVQFARGLGIECQLHRINVPARSAEGLEAAARRLRYATLAAGLPECWGLLTAHHASDQAETFLLAALKGSGPAGLAAMPRRRPLGRGWLGRPLLACPAAAVAAYAERHRLQWVDDPSNRDPRFDRNFLRLQVFPLLSTRFPAERRFSAAAGLQADAQRVLDQLLDDRLDTLQAQETGTLEVAGLLAQPEDMRPWLLRRFLSRQAVPAPRGQPLREFLRQLGEARDDSRPELHWSGTSLRVFRGRLHLVPDAPVERSEAGLVWPAGIPVLQLPDGRRLSREELAAAGIPAGGDVRIGFRAGGETLRTPAGRRPLKKIMQERGVPPWRRGRIPLVWLDDELVAVLWER